MTGAKRHPGSGVPANSHLLWINVLKRLVLLYMHVKLASLNVKQSPQVAKVAQRYHVDMNLKRCAEDINDEGIADMASYENGSMDSDNDEQRECLGEA
ncbi:hypothetical protein Tco_0826367 [Tanacetum coccineum]